MRIKRWEYKALLQRGLSIVPAGHRLNYVFQRATGGVPISAATLQQAVDDAETHLRNLKTFGAADPGDACLFEFGAGWDLHVPLALAALGAGSQSVLDLTRHLRPGLAIGVAESLASLLVDDPRADADRLRLIGAVPDGRGRALGTAAEAWLKSLSLHYRAPADARATGIPSESIDLATSTNTLEHIPPSDITKILAELRRILAVDGIASFQIDYQDHWGYFDGSISAYNFLRYDEETWRRYSPSLHFQNRLRHVQYLDLFESAGYQVLHQEVVPPSASDLTVLEALPIDRAFSGIEPRELGIRTAWVVLMPSR